jgi:hypothetical protein
MAHDAAACPCFHLPRSPPLEPYTYGSRGPAGHDQFLEDSNYVPTKAYVWRPPALTRNQLASVDEGDVGAAAAIARGVATTKL